MKPLYKAIKTAEQNKKAIAHFNVSTLEQLKAIAGVAKRTGESVIVGVSEGEREFIGLKQIVALVESYKKEGTCLYLNADHTRSLEGVADTAEAGFDSIIFDGANLSFEENVSKTKEAVKICKKHSLFRHKIILEGELGYIGMSSEILDKIPEGAATKNNGFTSPEDTARFVKETGIDMLAPAVGNIHGILQNGRNPSLDIEQIRKIRKATGVPLVLHGGSGVSDNDFHAAIRDGISVIHISTELRVAWKKGIEESFIEYPGEVAPYKLLKRSVLKTQEIVENRIRLFSGIGF